MAVPLNVFNDAGFQTTLTQTLVKMSRQEAPEMKATARKSGNQQYENRDTNNPKLVTEFLMSYLQASGNTISVARTWKNTREEVLWSNGSAPWRRSPVWLLSRVAMQVTFSRLFPSGDHYKEAMVFFMAQILNPARAHRTSSDLLHCLISKISKRLAKLTMAPGPDKPAWLPMIEDSLSMAVGTLQATWSTIMKISDPDIQTSGLAELDFAKDCATQLPELDKYIKFVKNPPPEDQSRKPFSPPSLISRFLPGLPAVASLSTTTDGTIYVLAAFETWVASELDTCLHARLLDTGTCGQLTRLIERYHSIASKHYKSNPENISLMILTCLELWIACDKSACQRHPLLLDYDPRLPKGLLESLILPLKAEMERLLRIEEYLDHRRSTAKPAYPSVFASFGEKNSFALRYYASSKAHKDLLAVIEEKAHRVREEKKRELAGLKEEYDRLMALHRNASCKYERYYDPSYECYSTRHSGSCKRCDYRTRAQDMEVELHEWPLPIQKLRAQAVVFEIDCPQAFDDWRDATLFLILDVLKPKYAGKHGPSNQYSPAHCLGSFIKHQPQRFSPVSETKPHKVTHRAKIQVSLATEDTVCVNNGLTYEYNDGKSGCLAVKVDTTEDIPMACTYQLQRSKSLQDFIYRPHLRPNGPEPNVVISQQFACPQDMSLEEFKALAALPLGTRIQWLNILLQLSVPSIDFKKLGTNLVLLQVIRQTGPPSGKRVTREGHEDLQDELFGRRLLHALQVGAGRIKENWESCQALGGFIAIAARLLSLSTSAYVTETCLEFLGTCRQTARGWAHRLRETARLTVDYEHRDELLLRAFEISQICASTFDIDLHHLKDVLGQSSESCIFLECSIMIQETAHTALTDSGQVATMCHQRWKRLASRAFPILLGQITRGSSCLDDAIKWAWAAYRRGTVWSSHSSEAQHWVTNETEATPNSDSQSVHFNLLSGELLVDGLPLSRLPPSFKEHTTYKPMFGRSTIEVMPTNMEGMQFSAMKPFQGYEIYVGLHKYESVSRDFRITSFKDGERFDLLPSRLFSGKMPEHFVADYAHWYCHSTNSILFRPIASPWTSPQDPWVLSLQEQRWFMRTGNDCSLISMTSRTSDEMHRIVGALESEPHTHMFLRHAEGLLEVVLPRLNLNFFLHKQSDRLESRQFRGMHVRTNAQIGTLVGLESKLVLSDDHNRRIVLIPNGTVTHQHNGDHISVRVKLGTSDKVRPYQIDRQLGRIVDNGTLESKLSLCYLHALTSFCVPDELTKKTGTEQALEILNSAAVRSFDGLSTEHANVLRDIASLAPFRTYYPAHEREMQSVTWVQGLSFLSQHGRLCTDVESILAHATSLDFFYEGDPERLKKASRGSKPLIRRDLTRSSVFRSSCFGAEPIDTAEDSIYTSRGSIDKARYTMTLTAASRVLQELQTRQIAVSQQFVDLLWNLLHAGLGSEGRMANAGISLPSKLVDDAERLSDWQAFLGSNWCRIHRAFTRDGQSKYSVMMFLATIAFSSDIAPQAIEVLVALFTSTVVGQTDIPEANFFQLGAGYEARLATLMSALDSDAKDFYGCPEHRLPKMDTETDEEASERRRSLHTENRLKAIREMAKELQNQWPREIPETPSDPEFQTYIKMSSAMGVIKDLFKLWWDNCRFRQYLGRIETAIRGQHVAPLPGSMSTMPVPPTTPNRPRAYLTVGDYSQNPPQFCSMQLLNFLEVWYALSLMTK